MHFLGIEISHGGTRAVALDLEAAAVCAEAFVPHAWVEGLPAGFREQDPALWIDAVNRVVIQCLSQMGEARERVAAIGVAGPQRGLVLLDDANRIIRPAKMSGDLSVKRQADEIARAFGGSPGLIELVGQSPGVDSAAAECLWLKQHEPYHFQRAASLLTAQDFISYWLSGERITEAGSASATGLFDIRKRTWSAELIEFIDPGLAALLPPVSVSHQPRGTIRQALAREWGLSELVQVSSGSGSAMLSALAAGCVEPGTVAVEMSSTGLVMGTGIEPVIDLRGEIQPFCNATGGWLGTGSVSNVSVAPEILRRHYGWSFEEYEANVSSVQPGADGLLMLPYFTGETIPKMPEGTGVLHGITPGNFTPAHLARAAAEGVVLGIGYVMSRFRDLGFDPPEIRLLGPGAASPVTRQLLADALGTPVAPVSSTHGAAMGAAMQAAVSFFHESGESLGFSEIATYLVSGNPAFRCEPNMEAHELYQEMISKQQYLVDTLHPAGFL
jgi:xylulokinase